MTHNLFTATVLCFLLVASTNASSTELERNGATGVRFTENRGQIVDSDGRVRNDIRFTADCGGVRLYFSDRGVSYVFAKSAAVAERPDDAANALAKAGPGRVHPAGMDADALRSSVTQLHRVHMELLGGAPFPRIRFEDEMPGYTNYYYPHCPDGITHVKSYATAVYEDVYPSIDLVFMTVNGRVKYEYRVHPGGNPADIRMRYNGASDMALLPGGILAVHSPLGWMEEAQPYSYQDAGREVRSAYRLRDDELSFEIGQYDGTRTLVIDPWATYFGGSNYDFVYGIVADGNQNVLIHGLTSSSDFPVTTGAFQTAISGYSDYYLAKFSANGSLLWSTYYGGSLSASQMSGLAVDSHDNAIIVGRANDVDFPVTAGAYQTSNAGGPGDGFIVKFDPAGYRLWATYFGGTDEDEFHQVAVDGDDNLYVCGCTISSDFPTTTGAFQPRSGRKADAVLVKLSAAGFPLWSTHFGGRGEDYGIAVALDNSANVILHGYTTSQNLPVTPGAFQNTIAGSSDLYLAKFSSAGALLWASYLGGSGEDIACDVATDSDARIVFTGYTSSTDFPVTPGALQTAYGAGNYDGFIGKFDAAGARLWTTYCGGNDNWDVMAGIATDGNDDIIVAGYGYSTDFPVTPGALQTVNNGGAGDMYITKLNPAGQQIWGTYLGGPVGDVGRCVATDANDLILVGGTAGPGVPVLNAYQTQPMGMSEVYIICLDAAGQLPGYNRPPVAVASASVTTGTAALTVQFTGSASSDPDGSIVSWDWAFGDGGTAAIADPSHTYSLPGVYTATLTVTDNGNATATDDVTITVTSTSSGTVRVVSQDVTRVLVQSKADRWEGRDLVVVRDAYNIPVSGAVVTANYSGPNSGTTSGTTNSNGEAVLATESQKSPSGVWCFDITGVQASGYTYDAAGSVTNACEAAPPKRGVQLPATVDFELIPNPVAQFGRAVITLPQGGTVELHVYDLLGRDVAMVAEGSYGAGSHTVAFDVRFLPQGTYLCRLETDGHTLIKVLTVLK